MCRNVLAKIYLIIIGQRSLLNIDLGNFGNIPSDTNILLKGLKMIMIFTIITRTYKTGTSKDKSRTNKGKTNRDKTGTKPAKTE